MSRQLDKKLLCFAHRGATGHEPENTLLSVFRMVGRHVLPCPGQGRNKWSDIMDTIATSHGEKDRRIMPMILSPVASNPMESQLTHTSWTITLTYP